MNNDIKVFCILGPTGIGKTLMIMELYNLLPFPIEIISVDSGLIYKEMNIGTAKPSLKELSIYPHKLVNILDPKKSYSVSDFFYDVNKEIYCAFLNKKIPILVGGTMMYYNVLFNGLYDIPNINNNIRNYVTNLFKKYDCKSIYKFFRKIDYNSAKNIHFNDKYRIIRNLEVYFSTNKNMSFYKKNKIFANFNIYKIIILNKDKNKLFLNIKNRFLNMLNIGFEEEVKSLYNRKDLNINMSSMKRIGYNQMWLYFDKKISYKQMISLSIKNTNFLVKKQITWLKKWLKFSKVIYLNNYNSCINKIYKFIKKCVLKNY